jgi:hypothetical protein
MDSRTSLGAALIGVSMLVIVLSAPIFDDPRVVALCLAAQFLVAGAVVLHAGLRRLAPNVPTESKSQT